MAWYHLAGSAVSALGGLLGGSSANSANLKAVQQTNDANKSIAQMNNAYNERMMREQMRYNTEMWEKENAYNTAAMQAQRLREAGLNPALVMSGQNAGTAGSAGGITPPTASPVQMQSGMIDNSYIGNSLDKLSQGFIAHQQLQNDKARVAVEQQKAITQLVDTLSNVHSRKIMTQGQQILNNYLDQSEQLRLDNMRADAGFKRAQSDLAVKQGMYQDVLTLISNKQLGHLDAKHAAELSEIASRTALNLASRASAYQGIEESKQRVKESDQNISLSKQQEVKLGQEIRTEFVKRTGMRLSNEQLEKIMPYIIKRAEIDARPRNNYEMLNDPNKPWWDITPNVGYVFDQLSPIKLGR